MPPINVLFFLCRELLTNTHLGKNRELKRKTHQCNESFFQIMTVKWDIHSVRQGTLPTRNRKHTRAIMSCDMLKVKFFWNMVYHTKLSNSITWHDNQAFSALRLCCDPQFSFTRQHQRDVYNRKSLVTSSLLSGLHARHFNLWLSM